MEIIWHIMYYKTYTKVSETILFKKLIYRPIVCTMDITIITSSEALLLLKVTMYTTGYQ